MFVIVKMGTTAILCKINSFSNKFLLNKYVQSLRASVLFNTKNVLIKNSFKRVYRLGRYEQIKLQKSYPICTKRNKKYSSWDES